MFESVVTSDHDLQCKIRFASGLACFLAAIQWSIPSPPRWRLAIGKEVRTSRGLGEWTY
jgi:hypothetical protein